MAEMGLFLGFVEKAMPWQLRSPQFPSKIGGRPAWLSQCPLPDCVDLQCGTCQAPMAFLLQVYAPIVVYERSFHRTLFVFCCRTPSCYAHNDSRCFKVFRSQLPRKNDFYSSDPPPVDEPTEDDWDPHSLQSGVKLCRVCGCPGPKACARCHAAQYCSKEHQVLDWKTGHKHECCVSGSPPTHHHKFLFPEFELLTMHEELLLEEKQIEASVWRNCPITDELEENELEENELEEMAMHETDDNKVFQKFKETTAADPHQVVRYYWNGSPLWVSAEHVPKDDDIQKCPCGAQRVYEFQIMPQLLNHLKVDSLEASIDWGTLAVYTCKESCDQGNSYTPEYIWKQDFSADSSS